MERLKQIILRMLSLVGRAILGLLSLIGVIVSFVGCMFLISTIQAKLFLPQQYIIWIFKYPISNLVFIYEVYIILGFAYALSKSFRGAVNFEMNFIKRHKVYFLATFISLNIIMIYSILYNVTVITDSKIMDYTFFSPQGKEYGYSDIVKIDAGIYGRKSLLPFAHFSKGDFFT